MSIIKFRKGKFAHFIASPPAFVAEVVLPFYNSLGGKKSSLLERVTTYSGEIVVMESVDSINFTVYLHRLGTGKITK